MIVKLERKYAGRLTHSSRTTSKESRLPEYLSTFDEPDITGAEIALIDEAGAKEHHRYFVRRMIVSVVTAALLNADISHIDAVLSSGGVRFRG